MNVIELDNACTSNYEQAAAPGKPAPARGPGSAVNNKPRVRYLELNDPISCSIFMTLVHCMNQYWIYDRHDIGKCRSRYRYIPILVPISGFPISGHSRYRVSRYRVCPDIGIPDIGKYPISGVFPISGVCNIVPDIGFNTMIGIYRYRDIMSRYRGLARFQMILIT